VRSCQSPVTTTFTGGVPDVVPMDAAPTAAAKGPIVRNDPAGAADPLRHESSPGAAGAQLPTGGPAVDLPRVDGVRDTWHADATRVRCSDLELGQGALSRCRDVSVQIMGLLFALGLSLHNAGFFDWHGTSFMRSFEAVCGSIEICLLGSAAVCAVAECADVARIVREHVCLDKVFTPLQVCSGLTAALGDATSLVPFLRALPAHGGCVLVASDSVPNHLGCVLIIRGRKLLTCAHILRFPCRSIVLRIGWNA